MKYLFLIFVMISSYALQAQKPCEFLSMNMKNKRTGEIEQTATFGMSPRENTSTNYQVLKIVRKGDSIFLAVNLRPNKKTKDTSIFYILSDSLTLFFNDQSTVKLKTNEVRNLGSVRTGSSPSSFGAGGTSGGKTSSYEEPYYFTYYINPELLNILSTKLITRMDYLFANEKRRFDLEDRFNKRIRLTFECMKETK